VEFDFFGPRPVDANIPQGRVLGAPRVRLAYVQLSKGTWKLVAGQDQVIVAPLVPISLSHVAVPLGATAGNLWGWLPQVRLDKTYNFSGKTSALVQVGVLRPDFSDPRLNDNLSSNATLASTSLDNSTAGTRSIMPFYQARAAVSHPMNGSNATVGAGVHYGRETVGVNHHVDSWVFALDFRVPLQTRLILRGETYAGSNLIPFQGGIDQGVATVPTTTTPFTRINKIGDGGGWAELTIRATTDDKNHVYLGAGTDDPKDRNLLPSSNRTKNTFYWASYFHRFTNKVTIAWEWSNWQFRTRQFTGTAVGPKGTYGRANVFNLSLGYSF